MRLVNNNQNIPAPEPDSIPNTSSPDSSSPRTCSIPDESSPEADTIPDKLGKTKLTITVKHLKKLRSIKRENLKYEVLKEKILSY